MKTIKKGKEEKVLKNFCALKLNELFKIKGGDGDPTSRDNDFD